MSSNLWIIEARVHGQLDFAKPQPEGTFGMAAITGITEDAMAKIVFRHVPDATLSGTDIPTWPARIDPRWVARPKTW